MTDQSSPTRLSRSSNDVLEATSFLSGTNAAFVEALYAQYLENPDAVDESWRAYFSGLGQNALTPAQLGRGPAWKRDKKPELASGDPTLGAKPAGKCGHVNAPAPASLVVFAATVAAEISGPG